jgi:putative oxidoreductase
MPQALMLLVGRVCLAALFVLDGWTKLRGYGAAGAAMRGQGIPFAAAVLPLAILVELGGGLAVVAGFKARLAAWLLIVICALVNYYSPSFARAIGGDLYAALPALLNQLAIIGGLLFLAASGPGRISLDRS